MSFLVIVLPQNVVNNTPQNVVMYCLLNNSVAKISIVDCVLQKLLCQDT